MSVREALFRSQWDLAPLEQLARFQDPLYRPSREMERAMEALATIAAER